MICLPRFLRRESRSDSILRVNVTIALDSLILAIRACLNSESPDWIRDVYAGLLGVRKRMEERGER